MISRVRGINPQTNQIAQMIENCHCWYTNEHQRMAPKKWILLTTLPFKYRWSCVSPETSSPPRTIRQFRHSRKWLKAQHKLRRKFILRCSWHESWRWDLGRLWWCCLPCVKQDVQRRRNSLWWWGDGEWGQWTLRKSATSLRKWRPCSI